MDWRTSRGKDRLCGLARVFLLCLILYGSDEFVVVGLMYGSICSTL